MPTGAGVLVIGKLPNVQLSELIRGEAENERFPFHRVRFLACGGAEVAGPDGILHHVARGSSGRVYGDRWDCSIIITFSARRSAARSAVSYQPGLFTTLVGGVGTDCDACGSVDVKLGRCLGKIGDKQTMAKSLRRSAKELVGFR